MAISLDELPTSPYSVAGGHHGFGLAVCPTLGLAVTSGVDNTLWVYTVPSCVKVEASMKGLNHVYALGGPGSPAPMRFRFVAGRGAKDTSGWMAFSSPPTSHRLLVTDAGLDAVHVIDVVGKLHVGYVAAPGAVAGPRGVAARGSLVAVSAWKEVGAGDHVVRLFEEAPGPGCRWRALRVLAGGFGGPGSADGQLECPFGLRFTADGAGVAVVDRGNKRVTLLRVEDGAFVRHVATGLARPFDVEECRGGWLVASDGARTVTMVGHGGDGCGEHGPDPVPAVLCRVSGHPSALALLPGLGLVVRMYDQVQLLVTPDATAMDAMSHDRAAWMVAVYRAVLSRGWSLPPTPQPRPLRPRML
jgi:hypothetical protein